MKWSCHIDQHIVQRVSPDHVSCNLVNGSSGSPRGNPSYSCSLWHAREIGSIGFSLVASPSV
eukprot:2996073-Lingulodinium_polyedra.AAC.1